MADHLEATGVQPDTYHLFGAHVGEAFVMDHRPEGWVVFYSERGNESSLRTYQTEAEACADLLARVTVEGDAFFELVAGPAPKDEADHAFDEWLKQRRLTRADVAATDWKYDDVPWVEGPYWRRYFVRISAFRP